MQEDKYRNIDKLIRTPDRNALLLLGKRLGELKIGDEYTVEQLSLHFDIRVEQGLIPLLKEKSRWGKVSGANKFKLIELKEVDRSLKEPDKKPETVTADPQKQIDSKKASNPIKDPETPPPAQVQNPKKVNPAVETSKKELTEKQFDSKFIVQIRKTFIGKTFREKEAIESVKALNVNTEKTTQSLARLKKGGQIIIVYFDDKKEPIYRLNTYEFRMRDSGKEFIYVGLYPDEDQIYRALKAKYGTGYFTLSDTTLPEIEAKKFVRSLIKRRYIEKPRVIRSIKYYRLAKL